MTYNVLMGMLNPTHSLTVNLYSVFSHMHCVPMCLLHLLHIWGLSVLQALLLPTTWLPVEIKGLTSRRCRICSSLSPQSSTGPVQQWLRS